MGLGKKVYLPTIPNLHKYIPPQQDLKQIAASCLQATERTAWPQPHFILTLINFREHELMLFNILDFKFSRVGLICIRHNTNHSSGTVCLNKRRKKKNGPAGRQFYIYLLMYNLGQIIDYVTYNVTHIFPEKYV